MEASEQINDGASAPTAGVIEATSFETYWSGVDQSQLGCRVVGLIQGEGGVIEVLTPRRIDSALVQGPTNSRSAPARMCDSSLTRRPNLLLASSYNKYYLTSMKLALYIQKQFV
ncbi:hypothetical protein EVAR_62977_1 [Eumeta japonica]|uniref:Uncharacterized protein n=1 Tax=Eumeta variegata TaxID=151549 RepID=A0A4C1ZFK7_EUMVA|nr:hypothetical protein EVAR_62977_1 [Eumeta japonica]